MTFLIGKTTGISTLASIALRICCNILNFLNIFIYHMSGYFACMHIWAPCPCLVPKDTARKHQFPWNHSYYGCLWAAMWMLGTQPQSSTRAISALNHWAVSPDPTAVFLEGNKLTICYEDLINCLIIYFSVWGECYCFVDRVLLCSPHWPWTDSQPLRC